MKDKKDNAGFNSDGRDTDISALLPHRPPMVLIGGTERFDAETRSLTAYFKVTPGSPFFDTVADGVPSWAAIEYMAQTAAALSGRFDLEDTSVSSPRPGLLLGTRKLTVDVPCFANGETYHVRAVNEYSDSDAAAFKCAITDSAGKVVASATLNAYRPPDFGEFLRSAV